MRKRASNAPAMDADRAYTEVLGNFLHTAELKDSFMNQCKFIVLFGASIRCFELTSIKLIVHRHGECLRGI